MSLSFAVLIRILQVLWLRQWLAAINLLAMQPFMNTYFWEKKAHDLGSHLALPLLD